MLKIYGKFGPSFQAELDQISLVN